jgi:4'-phosphopantetheinyl transferase
MPASVEPTVPASADGTWMPGPSRPLLADEDVHVWRANLSEVAGELRDLLCSEERARAERILNERDSELWGRSRGLLRVLVGRYLGQDPRSLRFTTGEHGKPALLHDADKPATTAERPPGASARLSFNMSHSGELALYAFSAAGAVGVDVEVARRPIDEVALAARTLGEATARRLQALDPARRQQEFLQAWARHEAELKCLGVGIGGAGGKRGAYRPTVLELELGPKAAAAVASERPARELRCWDWQPWASCHTPTVQRSAFRS